MKTLLGVATAIAIASAAAIAAAQAVSPPGPYPAQPGPYPAQPGPYPAQPGPYAPPPAVYPPPPAPYPPPPQPAGDPFGYVPAVRVPGATGVDAPRRTEQSSAGRYLHDGFYFRVGLGLSIGREAIGSDGARWVETGGGVPLDIALGGAVGGGLVLGGGLYVLALGQKNRDLVPLGSDGTDVDPNGRYSATLAMLGPFLDWYPDPKDGFHLLLAPSFAGINLEQSAHSDYSPGGVGVVAGAGKEWWIGGQSSMGVMARFTAARVTQTIAPFDYVHSVVAFGAQATFTYQ